MSGPPRERRSRRPSVPPGVGPALTLALALVLAAGAAAAPPGVPPNATPDPSAGPEGYPAIGGRQKAAILGEAARASLGGLARRPVRTAARAAGRLGERLAVRARELTIPLGSALPGPHDGRLDAGAGGPCLDATLTLLPSSEAAVRGLLGLVASAQARIDILIYGWEDDPTGREVADALGAAAGRGVRVRLVVNRGGFLIHNAAAARGGPTFLDALRCAPNVTLVEPGDPLLRLDHRKLAVADGRAAWAGGMILTEVARRRWENLAFLAEGPAARAYQSLFDARWAEVGGAAGPAPDPPNPAADPAPNARVRLVRTDVGDRSLRETLYHAVDHARHHIYVENPYFSDEVLAAKLAGAARRGVDVRAVLTVRGNVKELNAITVLTANRLLRGGARVYLLPGMTHVKAASADGTWCYLGSGNFDDLSLRNNREAALSVFSPGVTAALDDAVFRPDVARAQEATAPLPVPPPLRRLGLLFLTLWD